MEPYIKVKFNSVLVLKWVLLVFFLLFNLGYLAITEEWTQEGIFLTIVITVVADCLAVFSFIMLSFFPRIYLVFDEEGCSSQNWKGKRYVNIPKEDILSMNFGYMMGIFPGLDIVWRNIEQGRKTWTQFEVSKKNWMAIYNAIPWVKEMMDSQGKNECAE